MSEVILDSIITQYVSPDFNEAIPSIGLRLKGSHIEIYVRNRDDYIGLNQSTDRPNTIKQDIIEVVSDYMMSLSVASAIYESPHVAMFVNDAHSAPSYRKYLTVMNSTPMESNSQYWLHAVLPSSISYGITVEINDGKCELEINIDDDTNNYSLSDKDIKYIFDKICTDDPNNPLLPATTPVELATNNILRGIRSRMDIARILINKVADDIMPDAASIGELLSDEELLNEINSKDSVDEKSV